MHQITGRSESFRQVGEAALGGAVERPGEKGDFPGLPGNSPLGLDRGQRAARRIDRGT